eukprot:7326665-Alexandrium_andersonii.AAC.1
MWTDPVHVLAGCGPNMSRSGSRLRTAESTWMAAQLVGKGRAGEASWRRPPQAWRRSPGPGPRV